MILGIGSDIASIDRITKTYQQFQDRFLQKVFHPHEIESFEGLLPKLRMAFLAKRFAAKEAFAKALGTGFFENCILKQIYVHKQKSGQPEIRLDGETSVFFEAWCQGPKKIHLSLSDDAGQALAFVVIEGRL
jgi:holo-[acyl-carrier protein] synthase